ncbi:MAG: glycosyltransferase [Cyclobacteriaceae bacterium]
MGLLISVIIPVYNDHTGLITTLTTLTNQTLPESDYEIIVGNDGGSPAIRNICNDFGVICVDIIPNRGSYHARNQAMRKVNSKNFAFVDADISVPPNWLENGLNALQEADYVAGDVIIQKTKKMSLAELFEYYSAFKIQDYLTEHHFGVTGNLFVKGRIFTAVGEFDQRLRSSGDLEFGDRVYRHSKFVQKYSSDITVLHPPRGFRNYSRKIKRGAVGQVMLKEYYPDRFPHINPGYGKAIIRSIVPPIAWLKKMMVYEKIHIAFLLFIFRWYVNIMKGFYTVRTLLKR